MVKWPVPESSGEQGQSDVGWMMCVQSWVFGSLAFLRLSEQHEGSSSTNGIQKGQYVLLA